MIIEGLEDMLLIIGYACMVITVLVLAKAVVILKKKGMAPEEILRRLFKGVTYCGIIFVSGVLTLP